MRSQVRKFGAIERKMERLCIRIGVQSKIILNEIIGLQSQMLIHIRVKKELKGQGIK